MSACFWRSVEVGSAAGSPPRGPGTVVSVARGSRPARRGSRPRSARPRAICWRISADGLRRPRSIWLRYGFEIPASSTELAEREPVARALVADELPEVPQALLDAVGHAGRSVPSRASWAAIARVDGVDRAWSPRRRSETSRSSSRELLEGGLELVVGEGREVGERVVDDEPLEAPVPLDRRRRREHAAGPGSSRRRRASRGRRRGSSAARRSRSPSAPPAARRSRSASRMSMRRLREAPHVGDLGLDLEALPCMTRRSSRGRSSRPSTYSGAVMRSMRRACWVIGGQATAPATLHSALRTQRDSYGWRSPEQPGSDGGAIRVRRRLATLRTQRRQRRNGRSTVLRLSVPPTPGALRCPRTRCPSCPTT